MKRIQIGAVLGSVVALAAAGCSPVGDASGPDWFVVPDRFTDGLPDASAGSAGVGLSEDYMLEPLPSRSRGGSGGSAGGSAGSPNGGTGGSTLGDAGSEPSDGGPLAPFGIGDPWYFEDPEDMNAFTFDDDGVTSTAVWSAADGDGDGGHASVVSGHMDITIPFTAPNQIVHLRFTLPYFTDLSGRTLKVRVKRGPGIGQGGVQPFVQSNDPWQWVSGEWTRFSEVTELTDVALDFDIANDPRLITRFGIQIHSGTQPGTFETTHIAIDEIRIE